MYYKNIVICDTEVAYAKALGRFISERKELALQVFVCDHPREIENLEINGEIDYLLIASQFDEISRTQIKAKAKFVFTVTGTEVLAADEKGIFKYQSGEQILEIIFTEEHAAKGTRGLFFDSKSKTEATVIGVFSPVNPVEKSRYAQSLGKDLGRNANVLLISLQAYASMRQLGVESPATVADLLYFVEQEGQDMRTYLPMLISRLEGFDYLEPPLKEDLGRIPPEIWVAMVGEVIRGSLYEQIVLDIGEGLQGLTAILGLCEKVYLPYRPQQEYREIIDRCLAELSFLGDGSLAQKIELKVLTDE
ncbi:hypothetical protein M2145_001701 [Lachnospiraceae bacterium PF1-21]|uniref:hypothetical protein n=1 Tax=Ohessyouella blattaphilus TaxID=2949333 RepID=UPI003E2E35E1